jgi:hypothetical protein
MDENKRIEMIKKWQQLIYDEQAYTFCGHQQQDISTIRDLKIPGGIIISQAPLYNEWWVQKALIIYSISSLK